MGFILIPKVFIRLLLWLFINLNSLFLFNFTFYYKILASFNNRMYIYIINKEINY